MSKPTTEQIEAELAKLKELRPKIVPTSLFGTDNLAQLDACITVLEKRYTEEDCYTNFKADDDSEDEDAIDMTETCSTAIEAARWLQDMDSEDAPSDFGWPLKPEFRDEQAVS